MAELKTGDEELLVLRKFQELREGRKAYFYADALRLVTIGIGYLVDVKNSETAGQVIAKSLTGKIGFKLASGQPAPVADVLADWTAVKEAAMKASKPPKANYYAKIAKLRIDDSAIEALYDEKIQKQYLSKMYAKKPFAKQLDGYIQIAFVDALFNPAGVRLYTDQYLQGMWGALDPSKSTFNPILALDRFTYKWKGRGGPLKERYAQRHAQRVAWFKKGVQNTLQITLP